MLEENVEIIFEHIEAFNRGDVEALVATVSPDVEWEDAMFWSEVPRTYRGRDEVRDWFRRVLEPWESIHGEPGEIREGSDRAGSSVGLVWAQDSALYWDWSSSGFVWTPSRLLPFCCPYALPLASVPRAWARRLREGCEPVLVRGRPCD